MITTLTRQTSDWTSLEYLITVAREQRMVDAATRRDVFDLQLIEGRTEALAGRDRPLLLLERAAEAAGIAQCSICHGAASYQEGRAGCGEIVCDDCEADHAVMCEDHAAYLMEA